MDPIIIFIDSKTVWKQESFYNSFMSTILKRYGSAGKTVSRLKELGPDKNQLDEEEDQAVTELSEHL